jgi:signal transduction histidine kinase
VTTVTSGQPSGRRVPAAVWSGLRTALLLSAIVIPFIGWMSFRGGQSVPSIVRSMPLGLALSGGITAFVYALFPIAFHVTASWPRPAAWVIYVVTIVVCATGGTALAATVPFLIGVIDARDIAVVFLQNIGGTIPVSIVIGVVMILLNIAKARLSATELSLKAQQLERERAEKLAAEAQLASLSSRVQPHFLFNTLNSISGLIREQPAEAEAMIEHLSSLLRSSLDDRETIPLAHELRLATDYLEIQRTRLGSRVRYELAVASHITGTIPPFAVQTLVENSIKHVAGRRAEGVAMRIAATHDAGQLVVSVTDDGPGFDPDAMKAGHGLDVLERRLRAVFGSAASIEFDRAPGAMTVCLRVPIG